MNITLRVKLDEILKGNNNMTQKELKAKIEQKYPDKKVRAAAISELFNNQRKSLNKELIELIASTLEINDPNKLFSLDKEESE
jgi:hypothetical protein